MPEVYIMLGFKNRKGAGFLFSPLFWILLIMTGGLLIATGAVNLPSVPTFAAAGSQPQSTAGSQPQSTAGSQPQSTAGSQPQSTAGGGTIINIPAEDATVTLSASDAYDSSIAILGNHRYRTKSPNSNTFGAWLQLADGSSATTGSTDTIQIVWGDGNQSAGVIRAFADISTYSLSGSGAVTLTPGQAGASIYRNGTVNLKVFNEEGNLISGTGGTTGNENESIAAGDTPTLNFQVVGQFKRAAAPHGAVLIVQYNQSQYDDFEVRLDGQRLTKAARPDFYTVRAANFNTKTFNVPPIVSSGTHSGSITIDVDDTNSVATTVGAEFDIIVDFYPKELFRNTETDKYQLGIEDQNGAALNMAPTRVTIQVDGN
jgi:hypothetical protein